MRFRLEQRFPAPLPAVESALVDARFVERLARLPDLGRPELLDRDAEDGVVRQRVRYRFVGNLSPAVTAVVDPDRLTWVEESSVDLRNHRGQHRIVPDHYGGRLRCSYTTELRAEASGTTTRVAEGEVEVRFPLVGGRVERAIVSGLARHAEAEAELLAAWLAEEG